MATAFSVDSDSAAPLPFAGLRRHDRAIGGARFDAVFFWGAPVLALVAVGSLVFIATLLPTAAGAAMVGVLAAGFAILTYAHLIAVVPRAYLNREVFAAHKLRLTIVPVVMVAALAASPAVLVAGMVLAVFWDVHHTAMQNFGIGRIYDMKAGNDARALRRTDLWLAYALYIGPAAAGASMIAHFNHFDRFDLVGWHVLATVPGAVEGLAGAIRMGAAGLWLAIVAGALISYRRAARHGYAVSAHKLALLISTGGVALLAWVFAPPFVAFAVVNLFHAAQYFAIVWLKEGARIGNIAPRVRRFALPLFVAACTGFGVAYWAVAGAGPLDAGAWLAPFVACSLLHFWFDAFIWSVRKKLV